MKTKDWRGLTVKTVQDRLKTGRGVKTLVYLHGEDYT